MFSLRSTALRTAVQGGDSSQQHRVVSLKVAKRVDLECFYHTHTHTHTRMHPYVYNPCDMMDVEDNFIGVIILQVIRTLTCHIHLQLNLVAQSCLFATPWTAAHQVSLSFTISQSLLKLMSIELVMPSNHLILCHPLLLLLSIFPSIKVFSNESVLHIRWPKYWSFSVSISPSNEYSGLISFRMDWLDLLAIQGTR